MNEDLDRRRADRPWRDHLDLQLVTILTTQKVQADSLQELKDEIQEVHDFLRGGLNGQDPVETRLRDVERSCQEFKIILRGGPLGDGGLIKMLSETSGGRADRLERRGQSLGFYAQIFLVVATLAGGIMTMWGHEIKAAFNKPDKNWAQELKQEISTERIKRRKHRKPRPAPIEEETPDAQPEASN